MRPTPPYTTPRSNLVWLFMHFPCCRRACFVWQQHLGCTSTEQQSEFRYLLPYRIDPAFASTGTAVKTPVTGPLGKVPSCPMQSWWMHPCAPACRLVASICLDLLGVRRKWVGICEGNAWYTIQDSIMNELMGNDTYSRIVSQHWLVVIVPPLYQHSLFCGLACKAGCRGPCGCSWLMHESGIGCYVSVHSADTRYGCRPGVAWMNGGWFR